MKNMNQVAPATAEVTAKADATTTAEPTIATAQAKLDAAKEALDTAQRELAAAQEELAEMQVSFDEVVNEMLRMKPLDFVAAINYAKCHGNKLPDASMHKRARCSNADDIYCSAFVAVSAELGNPVELRVFEHYVRKECTRYETEILIEMWAKLRSAYNARIEMQEHHDEW